MGCSPSKDQRGQFFPQSNTSNGNSPQPMSSNSNPPQSATSDDRDLPLYTQSNASFNNSSANSALIPPFLQATASQPAITFANSSLPHSSSSDGILRCESATVAAELSYEQHLLAKLQSIRKFESITQDVHKGRLLNDVPLLSSIKQSYKEKLGALMKEEKYQANDVVFRSGEIGEHFYIVVKGSFTLYSGHDDTNPGLQREIGDADFKPTDNSFKTPDQPPSRLPQPTGPQVNSAPQTELLTTGHTKPNNSHSQHHFVTRFVKNDFFGESALLLDLPRQGTVVCNEPNSILLSLDKKHFTDCVNALDLVFPHRKPPPRLPPHHHLQIAQHALSSIMSPLHHNPDQFTAHIAPHSEQLSSSTLHHINALGSTTEAKNQNTPTHHLPPQFISYPAPQPYHIPTTPSFNNSIQSAHLTSQIQQNNSAQQLNQHHLTLQPPSPHILSSQSSSSTQSPSPDTPHPHSQILIDHLDSYPILSTDRGNKTEQLIQKLYSALSTNNVLQALPKSTKIALINAMTRMVVNPNNLLLKQGEVGRHLFIIESGHCDVFVNGEFVQQLKSWDCFGELSLLHRQPRAASVISSTNHSNAPPTPHNAHNNVQNGQNGQNVQNDAIVLWTIDAMKYREIVETNYASNLQLIESTMANIPAFNSLTTYERLLLVQNIEVLHFPQKALIFKQDELAVDGLYILVNGSVGIYHHDDNNNANANADGTTTANLGKLKCTGEYTQLGDIFGEKAYINLLERLHQHPHAVFDSNDVKHNPPSPNCSNNASGQISPANNNYSGDAGNGSFQGTNLGQILESPTGSHPTTHSPPNPSSPIPSSTNDDAREQLLSNNRNDNHEFDSSKQFTNKTNYGAIGFDLDDEKCDKYTTPYTKTIDNKKDQHQSTKPLQPLDLSTLTETISPRPLLTPNSLLNSLNSQLNGHSNGGLAHYSNCITPRVHNSTLSSSFTPQPSSNAVQISPLNHSLYLTPKGTHRSLQQQLPSTNSNPLSNSLSDQNNISADENNQAKVQTYRPCTKNAELYQDFNTDWYFNDRTTNKYYYQLLLNTYSTLQAINDTTIQSSPTTTPPSSLTIYPRAATAITHSNTILLRIRMMDVINILYPIKHQLQFRYQPFTPLTPSLSSSTPSPSPGHSHLPQQFLTNSPFATSTLISNFERPNMTNSASSSPNPQQLSTTAQYPVQPATPSRIQQLEQEYKRKVDERHKHRRLSIQSQNIQFEHLRIIAQLGAGAFGKVHLVKDVITNKTYALKSISKQKVHDTKQQEHILNEKVLLELIHGHPFIVNLYATVRTPSLLHFIFEACLGGDLLTLLRKRKVFTEPQAQFYIACICIALSYIHDKNIIYRDLKPENVVLDAKSGYAKLIDFGFAKQLDNIHTTRTKSICFTLDYLSPEMLLRQPYNHSVDIWALGVLIYELVAGYPPFYSFGSSNGDHQQMYSAILHANIQYPSHFSAPLKELIGSILTRNPLSRLGSSGTNGIYDIMSHPWFSTLDWEGLKSLTLKPPFQPSSKVVLKKPQKDLNNYVQDPKNQQTLMTLCDLDAKYHFNDHFGTLYNADYPDIWSEF